MLLAFFKWCEASALGKSISGSVFLFPVVEALHPATALLLRERTRVRDPRRRKLHKLAGDRLRLRGIDIEPNHDSRRRAHDASALSMRPQRPRRRDLSNQPPRRRYSVTL